MINLSEIMIYSVLSLFKWSFVCGVDEHFFFTFITFFNIGIVLITQTTRLLMGTLENPMYELISGNFNLSMNSGVFIFWKVFISIIALILLTGGIIISYKKYKDNQKIHIQQAMVQLVQPSMALSQQNYNNVAQNKPLLDHLQFLIIFIIWVSVTSTFIISSNNSIKDDEFSSIENIMLVEIFAEYFVYIMLPVLILSRKSTFRTYIIRELKRIFNLDQSFISI